MTYTLRPASSPAKKQPLQKGNEVPLLDQGALDRLRGELDDNEDMWKIFVTNFIAYLPTRSEKLRVALTTGDCTGALDAVLGLKTSSQMMGAERLAALAFDLEQAIRTDSNGDPGSVLPRLGAAHLSQIERCSRQTAYPLLKYLAVRQVPAI
jgi:HPt (histidine-containing phosphotransfer) domain-containing protein